MREFTLEIGPAQNGKSIKSILNNYYKISSNLMTKLKSGNGIMLNGEKAFVNKEVKSGDTLVLTLPDEASENIVATDIPLDILYEDEDILAVNKPFGMPTHPSVRHFSDTLANAVAYYYKDIPFTFRAVTRLDRDTSGVVLIAKNAFACDVLSKQLQKKQLYKEYLAVCTGIPSEKAGRICAPIMRAKEGIIKRCISPLGKEAISDYAVIDEFNGYCLVRLAPRTGRTHQLRVHLAHIGMPIYGDFLYGTAVSGERLRLHCRKLNFLHPVTGEKSEIIAPFPRDMDIRRL